MVDRIEKFDPKTLRVQESPEDRNRRGQREQQEEAKEKERDKFEKKGASLNKLIPEPSKRVAQRGSFWGGQPRPTQLTQTSRTEVLQEESHIPPMPSENYIHEEESLTLSQRVLVLWGIMDLKGKYRIPVIAAYAAVAGVILTATVLIMLGLLWL